jgi:DNA (cytosine-5)-methyltransferase 1
MAEDLDMVLERLESGRPYKSRLVEAVAMWPTPRSNPAMASLITSEIANDPRRFPNLETVVGQRMKAGDGGRLNPMWVEWLMGFPLGWTDLED